MSNITPKEAIEILSHYTDLGYGVVIEGEDTSKIKQALSFASKTLANGTLYNPSGDLISREALKDITYINKGNFNTVEGIREWIDNAPTVNTNAIADNEKSQGDLISREALRKEVTEKVNFTTVDGHIAYDKMLKLIDNAQSVDITEEQAINKLHETGWLIGHDKEMTTRPKGEWYYGEDECGQDGWFCSECGFFVPWYYEYYEKDINFIREYKACPHCLAEMVTYTGKDRDTEGGVE